jgi:hypothetical protein
MMIDKANSEFTGEQVQLLYYVSLIRTKISHLPSICAHIVCVASHLSKKAPGFRQVRIYS